MMAEQSLVDVKVRRVSTEALDTIRPVAQQHGYKYTNADVVRFAIALAVSMSRRVTHAGLIEELLREFNATPGGPARANRERMWFPGDPIIHHPPDLPRSLADFD